RPAAPRDLHALPTRRSSDLIVDQSRERIAAIDTNFRFTYLSRAYREAFERWYGVAVGPGEDVRSALEAWPDQCELAIGYWRRALDRKSTRLNSSHVKISYAV